MPFAPATKERSKLRMALAGPSGSGKTYTALNISQHMGKVALIDTERGSASKYADEFNFDVLELSRFHPENYITAIHEAEAADYGVLVIDSLTHAWAGIDGALELVDREVAKQRTPNSFAAWRTVTPLHNKLVDAMLQSNMHIIATMRAKTKYSQETDSSTGRSTIKKLGMEPVQREGMEYEFDVTGDINLQHDLVISKSRCTALTDQIFPKAGKDVADIMLNWLNAGVAPKPKPEPKPELKQEPTTEPKTVDEAPRDNAQMLIQWVRSHGIDGKRVNEVVKQINPKASALTELNPEELKQAFALFQG